MLNKIAENTYQIWGEFGPVTIEVKPENNQFWLSLMCMDEGLAEQRRALGMQTDRFNALVRHFASEEIAKRL